MEAIIPVPSDVSVLSLSADSFPLILVPKEPCNLVGWTEKNRVWIGSALGHHQAILFRNFGIVDIVEDFGRFCSLVSTQLLDYVYRSAPRTEIKPNIFTATEYPPQVGIPQHNENAYRNEWPLRIMFACKQRPLSGGQTPLARSGRVDQHLSSQTLEKFRRLGVLYVRNYRDWIDLPWPVVFQTRSKAQVEAFCVSNNIEYMWLGDSCLRTKERLSAFASHPRSGKELWFNQVNLFHVGSLQDEVRDAIVKMFPAEELPRNAYYGDGSPIEAEVFQEIKRAYDIETVEFDWETNDVLLVDNMMVSHGRRPFQGPRQVLVAMADKCTARPTQAR